ncbi:hypothetical protein CHS0354_004577 [Potamilus streckersoni]|uniref:G-protein coupled receptors family 1 profile domain-containing protein n=1 Tax=Potamilus streckersoni TaxID=2493646 RepID=A0AAE0S5Q0_9BIVA|nr:hypothetical protein CHS0354_004577 [Potamilus streckersoni]
MCHFLAGYWPFNAVLCDIFVTSDVLMCTSSILHLCTISLERFIAIRSPLTSRKRSKRTVFVKLGFVWLGSIAISSPIMILGFIDSNNIMNNNQCVLRNKEFIIYGSICAFFIPLGIMVIIYGLTVRLLRKQSMLYDPKRVSNGQPTIRRSKSRRKRSRGHNQKPHISLQMDSRSPSPVDYNDKKACSMSLNEFETSLNQINSLHIPDSGPRSRDTSSESLVTVHYDIDKNYSHNGFLTVPRVVSPRMSSTESLITSDNENDNSTDEDSNQNMKQYLTGNETPSTRMKIYFKKQLIVKASSILQLNKDPTKERDDKTLVRTEQKASNVLVLCRQCNFQPVLILIFVWLGYVSSTLNPIIYTMFNSTFKMTFVKLLKCQYGFLLKPLRRKAWSRTHRNHTTASSDSNAEIPL